VAFKILLADDSVTAQNLAKKILTDVGYEVIPVSNGAAAMKKIESDHPDLLILDVFMPGYSGLEVCEKVRNARETASIPVLLTVAPMEPYSPADGLKVRADGVILKPFEARDLLPAVEKFQERMAAGNYRNAPVEAKAESKTEAATISVEDSASVERENNYGQTAQSSSDRALELPAEMASAPAYGIGNMGGIGLAEGGDSSLPRLSLEPENYASAYEADYSEAAPVATAVESYPVESHAEESHKEVAAAAVEHAAGSPMHDSGMASFAVERAEEAQVIAEEHASEEHTSEEHRAEGQSENEGVLSQALNSPGFDAAVAADSERRGMYEPGIFSSAFGNHGINVAHSLENGEWNRERLPITAEERLESSGEHEAGSGIEAAMTGKGPGLEMVVDHVEATEFAAKFPDSFRAEPHAEFTAEAWSEPAHQEHPVEADLNGALPEAVYGESREVYSSESSASEILKTAMPDEVQIAEVVGRVLDRLRPQILSEVIRELSGK
jgi:CheY-like chemotaxis protein